MKILNKKLKAFSLIEISIVLIVIGLITTAVFKGQDLIESARLQATVQEMNQLKLSVIQYRDQFGQWPGNDSKAQQRFGGGCLNGSGRGVTQGNESTQAFVHLKSAGLIESEQPVAKCGGTFSLAGNPFGLHGNYIVLSGRTEQLTGVLTPQQALKFKAKAGESNPHEGQFIIKTAPSQGNSSCFSGQGYNLKNTDPVCLVLLKV